jgi:hypothetical protein
MTERYAELVAAQDGFRAGEYVTRVDEVREEIPDSAKVHGSVLRGEEVVGEFQTLVYRTADGRTRMHFSWFRMQPEHHLSGIYTAFHQHLGEACLHAGVDEIVFAAEGVGGYTSARPQWVEFMPDEREQVVSIWHDHGEEALGEARELGKMPAELAAELERLFAGVEEGTVAPPTPPELARLGSDHPWTAAGHELWFGKRLLIDTKWTGRVALPPPGDSL